MSTTIESLELQVQSSATSATTGIDALSASLSRLKNATKGGVGLNSVANQVRNLDTALKSVDPSSADKIEKLANSLSKLSGLGQIKISSSIANQIRNIGSAAASLNGVNLSGIGSLATALQPLNNLGRASGLQSAITQLQRLPQLAQTLNTINWATFTAQIQQLSTALAPLANQLNTVSAAFNNLPANIRRVVTATNSISPANNRAARSYVNLWARFTMAINAVRTGARVIASWITTANSYIEDLNLFTASMGQYAEEAKKYAETVAEIVGIDPGEWMRNQGVFNTILTGFGVVNDKAYTMSKNLTQLGYDISSFFNISYEDAMAKLQSGIAGELEPLRRIGYDLSVARLEQERLNLGIEKSVSNMTQAEKAQLRYYAIMTQVTVAQGDMARTLNAPANQLRVLQAQVTQCARALGNIFIPALNAVLPYAIALAKVLRMVADAIASFFGFTLPEVDYSGISAGAGAVGDLADGAGDAGKELGKAAKKAKELKNNLIGIDELNIISQPDDSGSGSGGSGGGAGIGGGAGDLGIDLPTYDFLGDAISSKVDEIVGMIKDAMSEITAVISGFLLAIGTILVVTGANIPLGLGLMAIGAVGLAATIIENWGCMSERLAKVLTLVTGVLGGFLLAIGAFLAFSGVNVPLGAALMVAGAVSLATAATINWKFLNGDLSNALSILTAIVGGALLAMGALFTFTGVSVGLGIALMVAGAVGLATAVGLNWDCMSAPMKKAVGALEAIVGGALLALGAVLAFTGVNVPLGIAMIAAGAIAIVSAVALNWDSITGDLKGSISTITAIVSGALIGIGAVLAFTGVATPLGIAMIAAGAVGLVATASLNWGTITGKITGVLKEIGIALGASLIALGAILAFTGVATPLGIALIAAGAVSLGTAVALNWNSLPKEVKSVVTKILTIAGAAALAIGAILAFTGVALPLGVGLMLAGAAALGSAVALNWNTFVNKIKGVINKILVIAGAAALAIGIILVCTGVGIPLGIGLILSGAASLGTAAALNWNTITSKIKGILTEWGGVIGNSLIAIGLLLCLTGAGIPIGLGLIAAGATAYTAAKNPDWNSFSELGKNVIEGFCKGIDEFFSDPIKFVKEHIVDPFVNGIKKLFKIESPSKVMIEIGGYVAQGLLNGILEPFKKIGNWIGKNIVKPLKKAIENSPVGEFIVNVKNTASEWWENVKSWWADVTKNGFSIETAVELVKKGWTTVKGWIGNIPSVSQMVGLIKSGWSSIKEWVGNIPIVQQGVELLKSGWETVKNWIGNIPIVSQAVNLVKSGWNTVKEWLGNIPTVSQAVSLIKSGWTTVKNWVGNIPTLSQAIGLIKSGWNTVKEWIGNIPTLSQAINLIKSGWTTVKNWIGNIPTLSQAINLIKSGWTTVKGWIGDIPTLSQAISLIKSGWTTVKAWIGNIPVLSQGISLLKSGWTTIANWIGNIPVLSQGISLLKSGWTTVKGWIGDIPVLSQGISLIKSGWTSISNWIGSHTVSVGISLVKSGWTSISNFVGTSVSVGVSLFKSGWSSLKSFFGLSSGGYNTGHGWKFFEKGGFMKNGVSQFWKSIPMYANGTNNAGLHGSMFVAGEHGAEMVGHINGQTEVLNKSQITMAMRSAVIAGMSQFTEYWRLMNSQMAVCANAIIRSILVSTDVMNSALVNNNTYDPANNLAQAVYEDSQRNYDHSYSDEAMSRSLRDFYREYVEPTLKEIASDTKRQADKEEQTIVQVGNRTINDAVVTQQKANGYVFAK